MAKSSQYSIIVDAELDLKKIEQQLKGIQNKEIKIPVSGAKEGKNDVDNLDKSIRSLDDSTKNVNVTYQQFRQVLDLAVNSISAMYGQVQQLDSAVTEYKKVTELSGQALDDYVAKLSEMGREVGRTGKPNRSEPVCRDGKAA